MIFQKTIIGDINNKLTLADINAENSYFTLACLHIKNLYININVDKEFAKIKFYF